MGLILFHNVSLWCFHEPGKKFKGEPKIWASIRNQTLQNPFFSFFLFLLHFFSLRVHENVSAPSWT